MKVIHLILLVLLFLISSCQEPVPQKPPQQVPTFNVVQVEQKTIVGQQYLPASIEGTQNIEIRPRIEGFIEKIYVDEGQTVRKGDMLFRLEVESLNQEAKAAKSSIDVAKAQVSVAQVEVDRLVPLVEKNIISIVQLETARANLASAESELLRATSSYKGIQNNVNYQNITSPVSGVVGKINFRQGSLVGRGELLPLTTVSDIRNVYAYFSMNEKNYFQFLNEMPGGSLKEKIKNAPEITLTLADESIYPHKGKIETTTGQVESETGSISFRAIFPNPDAYLSNGNSGQVILPVSYKNALIIPAQSTYETQGITHVYQLEQDSLIKAKVVQSDAVVGKIMIVNEGLAVGDKIVAQGIINARNGIKIKPMEQPLDSIIGSFNQVFK